MKRDTRKLESGAFDLLVIGGGITGAAAAWDAAQRGLRVALVERRDFGGATSAATGKLIHGGLRYLKNFELGIVRESLRERRIMEIIAPHQVAPMPFVVPTYGGEAALLKVGLSLYDALGFDKGLLRDPEKRIPGHRWLSKSNTMSLFPGLPREGLSGGFLYYDCGTVSPERLTFDFIRSAETAGATVANWTEVTGFDVRDGKIRVAKAHDALSGEEITVEAAVFLNASGCWADKLLGMLSGGEKPRVVRSKGIHALFAGIHPTHALAMITKRKRHVYLLPWRGLTLAGTTDTPYEGDPDDFTVTRAEIIEFIGELNDTLPSLGLTIDKVLASYGGIRPLADTDGAKDSYSASRRHEVVDHAKEGQAANLLSALGGKYTTSRALAAQVTDMVFAKLGKQAPRCRTAVTPLAAATVEPAAAFIKRVVAENPSLDAALARHLAAHYGKFWKAPVELSRQKPELAERVWADADETGAQILHAARDEMAVRLEDALFRRTGLCNVGRPPAAALRKCADIMAAELGWNDERISEELKRVDDVFAARCS